MRFTIMQLFALTTMVATLITLISAGEMGWSLIPILMFSQLFFLPRIFKWKRCPSFVKTRYHIPGFAVLILLFVMGGSEAFGWWQIPYNSLVIFGICPGILVTLQLVKLQSPGHPNLQLRIVQIATIWLPTSMVAIAFCYKTI